MAHLLHDPSACTATSTAFLDRFKEMQRLRTLCAQQIDASHSDFSTREGIMSCFSDYTPSPGHQIVDITQRSSSEEIPFPEFCKNNIYILENQVEVRKRTAIAQPVEMDRSDDKFRSYYQSAIQENAAAMLRFRYEYHSDNGLCCMCGLGIP